MSTSKTASTRKGAGPAFTAFTGSLQAPLAAAALSCALVFASPAAFAMGLGGVHVRSNLGEPLHAEIDVTALSPGEADTLRVSLADAATYQSAGLEMSGALMGASVTLQRRADGRPYLRVLGVRPVNDPFIDIMVDTDNRESGRTARGYTVLIDPPPTQSINTNRVSPPTVAAKPAAVPAPVRTATPDPYPSERRPLPAADGGSVGGEGSTLRVRRGDTAGAIARRYAGRRGVSFDQMLAALLRSNPDAFIGGNVHRLKAGAVLQVPTGDMANDLSTREARRQWIASGKNFKDYRRKLAKVAVGKVQGETSRRDGGAIESQVSDQSRSSAAGDKLTLAKPKAVAGKVSREEQVIRTRRKTESSARVAELAKNIEELNKLRNSASGTPATALEDKNAAAGIKAPVTLPGSAAPSAGAAASAVVKTPAVVAVETAANAPVNAASAAVAPASAGVSAAVAAASATASQALAAQAPASEASAAVAEPVQAASAAASAPAVAVVEPEKKPKKTPVVTIEEEPATGLFDQLKALALPLGGAAAALLGGLGYVLWRRRRTQEDAVDSAAFLESKLQADSFFDASGGQRIDTASRPGGVSSSMVYSPSQLDAAGDVDPVAEAGVYMAYNRDQQAEDILKEAMRLTPSRVAIYTTLMEIYAKRGDLKAFEVVAKEAYHLTNGQGEEWAKAASLGAQVDPQNPMYAGATPAGISLPPARNSQFPKSAGSSASRGYQMSTAPMSLDVAKQQKIEDGDLDLAFRDSAPAFKESSGFEHSKTQTTASTAGGLATAAVAASSVRVQDQPLMNLDFEEIPTGSAKLGDKAPSADALFTEESLSGSVPLEAAKPAAFDISGISLELPTNPGSLEVGAGDADPMKTKLELAREFAALGDVDGARDLAQEVINGASGSVRDQAKTFLATLI